jgi:hypothetical protein
MKAGIKVSSKKDKERIERALGDERVLNFVRQIGDIKAMTNPGLRDHAMKFYDGVLAQSESGGGGEAPKPE